MNHYKIVKQESVSGYNMDGTEQETGDQFVILNNDLFVDSFETLASALHTLAEIVADDDDAERVSMDVEV